MKWWQKQEEIARSVVEHPRVFVQACHSIGKTHLAGGLVNWHFDSYAPGITLTTAPTAQQVYELTWKEVRVQRRGRDMMPKAPRIEGRRPDGTTDPEHWAGGYTARDADAFQGRHEAHLLILFEEACGIDEQFWDAAESMLSSGPGNRMLVILNPVDGSSPARQRQLSGTWHTIQVSAFDHPNIAAQLAGQPKPFPRAIDLSWLEGRVREWCTPITASEARATDFQWPPGEAGRWYRPGPLFEGRVLGRWPTLSINAVWSDHAWQTAANLVLPDRGPWQIGCDVARFGDDDTAIHCQRGGVSRRHEAGNGWPIPLTVQRCQEAASWAARQPGATQRPQDIPIVVDDCGVGGGVVDMGREAGWNFVPFNGAWAAPVESEFPNMRSALWFDLAEAAASGGVSFAPLPSETKATLQREVMAPVYVVDRQGRRVVEPKDATKKRLGRSPDNADSVMLAYANADAGIERVAGRLTA